MRRSASRTAVLVRLGQFYCRRPPWCPVWVLRQRFLRQRFPVLAAFTVLLLLLSRTPSTAAGFDRKDDRDDLEASFFVGLGIDSFSSSELKRTLNPENSGDIRERYVTGFDFAYRLWPHEDLNSRKIQIWLYGETVHGLRSTEVECNDNEDLPGCEAFDPIAAPEKAIFIVRNATSLEALGGVRVEVGPDWLRNSSWSPTNLYFAAQAGFLTFEGSADDVVDNHHIGVGMIVVAGTYQGSYLEIGHGRNDIFLENRTDRWKIDGFFTLKTGGLWNWLQKLKLSGKFQPFAQFTVDVDLEEGSDSIQTYIGVDYSF